MSMQYGAKTVQELLKVIDHLGEQMYKFGDCNNGIKEILITRDEDDGSFTITSD
ncbi:hypothetical protein [Cytobacillus gottheilii]|uniref:hypothetical protein n=1 Tax=Cytobacillus gottheilii TaxID=859144 RepID=UPI001592E806|nr:hypothetical protein [Cytobacillus gottheilii]